MCSDPKSPGGSSVRSAIIICTGIRLPEIGRVQLVGELHADARAAREHTRAARRGAVRDAQLRVLAVGDDVLGVQLAIRHHLRQRHHRGGVRTDRIRGDDVDIGVLRRLRRRDAAVDANVLFLPATVAILSTRFCHGPQPKAASDASSCSEFRPLAHFQFSMSFGVCDGTARSSAACRPCSPCVIANAVSMRTTPVSKSSSGTPSRQPGRALLDADAASFAVVHEDLVEPVRAIEPDDARLRADQIAVVAGIAGAAAEAAVGLVDRLFFGVAPE